MKKLFFSLALLILSIGLFSFGQSSNQNCRFIPGQLCNQKHMRNADPISPNYQINYQNKNIKDKIGVFFYPMIIIGVIGLSYGLFLGIKKYKSKIGKLSDKNSDESGKL